MTNEKYMNYAKRVESNMLKGIMSNLDIIEFTLDVDNTNIRDSFMESINEGFEWQVSLVKLFEDNSHLLYVLYFVYIQLNMNYVLSSYQFVYSSQVIYLIRNIKLLTLNEVDKLLNKKR